MLPSGFQKDGAIWYKSEAEIMLLLALYQSHSGFQKFSIKVGAHVPKIADPDAIFTKKGVPQPAHGCWELIETLNTGDKLLSSALDAAAELSDADRSVIISDALRGKAIPLLAQLQNRDLLSEYIMKENALVSASLRRWLGLPPRISS
jgi:hypothetical protein